VAVNLVAPDPKSCRQLVGPSPFPCTTSRKQRNPCNSTATLRPGVMPGYFPHPVTRFGLDSQPARNILVANLHLPISTSCTQNPSI
jgi:hypothetical protein